MKLTAKFNRKLSDDDGNAEVSFTVENFIQKQRLSELEKDKLYSLEIKEIKSKRSISQNKYMWALLSEIDRAINGRETDVMDIYIMALEMAQAKYTYIGALEETESELRKSFRAVKKIKPIDLNGKDGYMYKCFIGSSKMNVKEMNELIDTVLDMAAKAGIDTEADYWKAVLK